MVCLRRVISLLMILMSVALAVGCDQSELTESQLQDSEMIELDSVELQEALDISGIDIKVDEEVVTVTFDQQVTEVDEVVSFTVSDQAVTESDTYKITLTQVSVDDNDDNIVILAEQDIAKLEPVSREKSGLDSIPAIDLKDIQLDSRLKALMQSEAEYGDSDYEDGIFMDRNFLIIRNDFEDNIIGDVGIGTSIGQVVETLGQPTFYTQDRIIYKAKGYLIGFKGDNKITEAYLVKTMEEYDADALNKVIETLRSDSRYKAHDLETAPGLEGFFEDKKYISENNYEAGNDKTILISSAGIEVEVSEMPCVYVHNNFEGNLYDFLVEAPELKVQYVNIDSNMEKMMEIISSYDYINEKLQEEGIASPTGIRMYANLGTFQESYQIAVRTTDYSMQDQILYLQADNLRWINDDYILGNHWMSGLPVISRVTPISDDTRLWSGSLFDLAGYTVEMYGLFSECYYEIVEVNSEHIKVMSLKNKHILTFEIAFDEKGILQVIGVTEDAITD